MEVSVLEQLEKAATSVLRQCMAVKKGETVLIVADTPLRSIGELLLRRALEEEADAMLLLMKPRSRHGEEPPRLVAEAMKAADVVLAPTSMSLTHTRARKEANAAGARMATLPGITAETMARTLVADYRAIAERSRSLAEAFRGGREVRVATPAGTDLRLSIEGREWRYDTGIYSNPGEFGNLPAGEAFVAPVEGTASGLLVVDGAMAGVGLLDQPLRLKVEDGFVAEITGGEGARRLLAVTEPLGRNARAIGELGLGTNDMARITGNVLEDEKVMGTAHVAIGNNMGFGGKIEVPLHLDGILLRPTVLVDGRPVVVDGKVVI